MPKPRPSKNWPANASEFTGVSRDSSVAVDVLSPMPTPGRGGRREEDTTVRGMFGEDGSDACPSSLPGPAQCCRGSEEWKRHLEHSPISLLLLVAMRVLNAGAIASGVVALYLGVLCAVEDLGLGGWAQLFLAIGSAEVGLGAFGIYATYFHIWLLFYLFAMMVLWLVAIWLALFLPGYYSVLWQSLKATAIHGGLQERFFASADPNSSEMNTLSTHGCIGQPFIEWHPACRGVLERYVEQELHLDMWRIQLISGGVLLVAGSISAYWIVGPRTTVEVMLDGARYMQYTIAVKWTCITLYWYLFLDWDWGWIMASIMCTVSVALCVVPCCISPGTEEVALRGRRASPRARERLKWWRPRFSRRCGILTYALLAMLSIITAWYCLSGQDAVSNNIRVHFGQFCNEDCQDQLRYTLRAECESRQDADAQIAAAAQETIEAFGESADAGADADTEMPASTGEGRRMQQQRSLVEDTDGAPDPCEVAMQQMEDRFVEQKMSQLDFAGWALVFLAEMEVLQCLCLLYKGWMAYARQRRRAGAPYREPSI